jgi:hypothetical protein
MTYTCCCIQYLTHDDGQKTYPKYVEFYSKNKFEKLLHLVGFVIRIYHNAWSSGCQNRLMHSGVINTTILGLCLSDMFKPLKGHPGVRLILSHSKIIKTCTWCKTHCSVKRVLCYAAASSLHVLQLCQFGTKYFHFVHAVKITISYWICRWFFYLVW